MLLLISGRVRSKHENVKRCDFMCMLDKIEIKTIRTPRKNEMTTKVIREWTAKDQHSDGRHVLSKFDRIESHNEESRGRGRHSERQSRSQNWRRGSGKSYSERERRKREVKFFRKAEKEGNEGNVRRKRREQKGKRVRTEERLSIWTS